jgi:hypothetical protein
MGDGKTTQFTELTESIGGLQQYGVLLGASVDETGRVTPKDAKFAKDFFCEAQKRR